MDVPKLVQEERFVEPLALVKENRTPECKTRHVGGAEAPARDSQGKTADSKSSLEKLRILFRQLPG